MSLAEVQGRIGEIQARLGLHPFGVLGAGRAASVPAAGTAGTGFSSTLTDALAGIPGSGTGDPSGPRQTVGERAVAAASDYLGVPYLWGGTDPAKGLDCSGLTQLVYGKLGVRLPRVAADQAKAGVAVPSLAQAHPGDLVFFGSPAHHVGIVVGDGKMIDAPHSGAAVGIHDIAGYGPISAIRRVTASTVEATGTTATAGALEVARAQLLSAAGLASLTALSPSASAPGVAATGAGFSRYEATATGASGLIQLMPRTGRSPDVDATDPAQGGDGAARLSSGLLTQFGGRVDLALAGYTAGAGAVRQFGGVPPYPPSALTWTV
ncbi:MAG TPA: NlpC/P60 family protein [Kineosporiaceae bacterium]